MTGHDSNGRVYTLESRCGVNVEIVNLADKSVFCLCVWINSNLIGKISSSRYNRARDLSPWLGEKDFCAISRHGIIVSRGWFCISHPNAV